MFNISSTQASPTFNITITHKWYCQTNTSNIQDKDWRVPLAASTRDDSPASSRSLMCSKPVTSLALALSAF